MQGGEEIEEAKNKEKDTECADNDHARIANHGKANRHI